MNIDAPEALRVGISTYKVGQTWPLDTRGLSEWADGLDLIVVVEEKRKLIEVQIKEALFDSRRDTRVFGARKGAGGEELFAIHGALDPFLIAEKLGEILIDENCATEAVNVGLAALRDSRRADNAQDLAARLPYFCAGCPHNTSTKVPEGSRAYAGIGCHYMAQWMDRETSGYTHMGGEGANWIGEAPFSTRNHVFQNLGDGTYNHSGIQAIRAAVAAGTTVTYKILYNDAVAMTGGQGNDGALDAPRIARELLAMGIANVALVHDQKEDIDLARFPKGLAVHERDEMDAVQKTFAGYDGGSVILYLQTCAAEKRRRRKRGKFPDPDKRVFINTDICEGCGDCGVQSNCVAISPVETELGRKRAIDQSACNKDFSCVKGFCPSFVTLKGAQIRKSETAQLDLPQMPEPVLPSIDRAFNVVITGVGGAGAAEGRAKSPVAAVVSVACRAAAAACSAYGTAAGAGTGRASTAGGGRKDPGAVAACTYRRA